MLKSTVAITITRSLHADDGLQIIGAMIEAVGNTYSGSAA